MKRAGKLLEQVTERDNLRLAFYRALRGKRDRRDARDFAAGLEANLQDMAAQVWSGRFPVGRCSQFTIHDPKKRIITAPCFAERVLHHAIMNVCEPLFERYLIDDTYACRREKGRIAALRKAVRFSGRFPVLLKLDIRKYFDSISHEVALERLERRFKDRRLLDLFRRIIASHQTTRGCGLPIGSLTSQHLANFYLGSFDRFIKEVLRSTGYVRYMDDCVVWGTASGELREVLFRCESFLGTELRLEVKRDPIICPARHGFEFLGCRVYPSHLKLNRRSRGRFRRRLTELEVAYGRGEISEQTLQERATSLVAFTTAGGTKSWQFRTRVLQQLAVSGHWARTG
ncbi:reverse transcriptase domain-containing protein [Candidatus Eisenbacteria bacterium]|uniref:Reverse transcriptase domain-containing protein n=1 Tax=Eiseniibacteriota bacterium TaxID=2212470 RepID=A0ABV6YKH5_UNCEI